MDEIIILSGSIAILTVGSVEVVKYAVDVNDRLLPLISILIGLLMGLIAYLVPELRTELSMGGHLISGVISGFAASGIFDTVTKTIAPKEKRKIND